MRRALLVEVVLQLLAIELDQLLPRRNTIAEIGEHATNDAVDLGRNRDLVLGSQRPNDFENASNRLLTNCFGLDVFGGRFGSAVLIRTRICAAGRHGTQHDQYEGTLRHKP